jgi:hypothetical protein
MAIYDLPVKETISAVQVTELFAMPSNQNL